jgi:hypothetical protein
LTVLATAPHDAVGISPGVAGVYGFPAIPAEPPRPMIIGFVALAFRKL